MGLRPGLRFDKSSIHFVQSAEWRHWMRRKSEFSGRKTAQRWQVGYRLNAHDSICSSSWRDGKAGTWHVRGSLYLLTIHAVIVRLLINKVNEWITFCRIYCTALRLKGFQIVSSTASIPYGSCQSNQLQYSVRWTVLLLRFETISRMFYELKETFETQF